jgi:hypothetical protein
MGDAIALADEVVSNEHATPEELASEIVRIVDRWVEQDAR